MIIFFHLIQTLTPATLCDLSVVEYCCPILSQNHYCKKFVTSLNEWLKLVSGCIKSAATELLSVLSGIEPVDIGQNKNILSFHIRAMESTQIFHLAAISPLTNLMPKSRIPLSTCLHRLSHDNDDISPEDWPQHACRRRWENSNYQLNNFIACLSFKTPGYDLKQSQWVLLNCLWYDRGRYATSMQRIGLSENANHICAAIQTRMIGIRGDLRTVEEEFCNEIGNNKLTES